MGADGADAPEVVTVVVMAAPCVPCPGCGDAVSFGVRGGSGVVSTGGGAMVAIAVSIEVVAEAVVTSVGCPAAVREGGWASSRSFDGVETRDRTIKVAAPAALITPVAAKLHASAFLPLRPGIASDQGATVPGATDAGERRVSRGGWTCGVGGKANALAERPDA